MRLDRRSVYAIPSMLLVACVAQEARDPGATSSVVPASQSAAGAARGVAYTEARTPCERHEPLRMALFGDVHVHTSFSFDAAANATGTTPADAHRFARGEAIPFWPLDAGGDPAGRYAIDRALDFLAVTDHGEFLGERALCRTPGSPRYDTPFCELYRSDQRTGLALIAAPATSETPRRTAELCGEDGALCRDWVDEPWRRMIEAAEAAYDRSGDCAFTSFVAYEYTGTPGGSNLHRNVIFRSGVVPDRPVSYIEAPADSLLWSQLDAACAGRPGCDYLTIPHNSNLANGRMAPYPGLEPTAGNRRAYAAQRTRREPIMEIFQHKGASECVNGLTSVLAEPDELCEVEQVRPLGREKSYVAVDTSAGNRGVDTSRRVTETIRECPPGEVGEGGMLGRGCVDPTDFIRSGLLVGLAEERELGANPVKLGIIASTDTHASTPGAVSETDWRGHVSGESTPAERLQPGLLTSNIDGNPGGLAGVWAVENSRDAIFEAMQRREVFGTSGPRIVPRFFAGWDLPADLCARPDMLERADAGGVPMGGDLPGAAGDRAPTFLATAARDPEGGRLQRLQLVKGWIEADGTQRTRVIDIAGSAENGAGVDPATGRATGDGGHDTLCAVHTDADFDAARPAYYYLRAVENPSARWSVHDCLRLPEGERPDACRDGAHPRVIHEMAWTSPIWYRP